MDRPGVESYIVRIYRRSPDGIAGVVELTRRRRQVAFRSIAQLETILRRGAGSGARALNKTRARGTR